jgi:hypothetical protein
MKNNLKKLISIHCVLLIGIFIFSSCSRQSAIVKENPANKTPAFEQQLAAFQKFGFRLNKGVKLSDIEEFGTDEEFRDPPYGLLYSALCSEIQREPMTSVTNNCWSYDVESVDSEDAYVDILSNLQRITRGEIVFEDVKSKIDFEAEKSVVEFSVKGKKYRWEVEVDDDWTDLTFFSRIVNLTRELNTKGKFTEFDTDGQNLIIGYETPEQMSKINQVTGLELELLK